MYEMVGILSGISLGISLFVETSSWWLKSLCPENQMGRYISRTNIYLYGGRFFSLIFSSGIAVYIESGKTKSAVCFLIAASFLLASAFQAVTLNRGIFTQRIVRFLSHAMFLRDFEPQPTPQDIKREHRLALTTLFTSYIFGIGTGLPLLAATLFPQHRLSISYLGQIINSAGTLVLMFFVDQVLYRSMDGGTLRNDVVYYTYGRVAGFSLAALSFFIGWLFLRGQ
jgi:hypothetical protein